MKDPLQKRLEKLKIMSESAKRRSNLYSDVANIDNSHTSKSLTALHKAPSPGKKLQKIGFIMLWVPEPTGVTCAVGGPMILAGKYLEKVYNSGKITDVAHQTSSHMNTISDFKKSLM